jgi:hypothetical protein
VRAETVGAVVKNGLLPLRTEGAFRARTRSVYVRLRSGSLRVKCGAARAPSSRPDMYFASTAVCLMSCGGRVN